ncbi:MAG: type III pantothenate kinase [Elusimicrobia bacterium]|nr:type III pantothenate kinase [Elusimicrobiota bacterium]
MILIDIGNTQIKSARVKKPDSLRVEKNVSTFPLSAAKFRSILKNAEFCVFCSVVPKASAILKKACGQKNIKFHRVTFKDFSPLKIKYRNPRKIGADRLTTALGAVKKFGAPIIVVDMGTAVTCELVSGKGEYLGGVIFPGISLSASALFDKTALLPKTIFKRSPAIGTDTAACIRRGIFDSIGGGIEKAVSDFKKIAPKAKIVFTGGGMKFFRKSDFDFNFVKDDLLVFRGLLQIYKNLYNQNQNKKKIKGGK